MMTQRIIDQRTDKISDATSNKYFVINFFTKEGEHKKAPLEFMWSLIQKYEVDIFQVSLKSITSDFLFHIQRNVVPLEQKSAFAQIAAQLIFYKSKYLLPSSKEEETDNGSLDRLPEELIDKLLEYKKIQVAAEHLSNTQNIAQTTITRDPAWQSYEVNIGFFKLDLVIFLRTFQQYLLKERINQNQTYHIHEEEIKVEKIQKWLHEKLIREKKLLFFDLVKKSSLLWMIGLFLAMLEMSKQKMIQISQIKNKNIMIELL